MTRTTTLAVDVDADPVLAAASDEDGGVTLAEDGLWVKEIPDGR